MERKEVMIDTAHVYGVILAGGGGTRLWPKSRNKTPKQFLKLTGKDSMVQVAAGRLLKIVPWERIIVVTNKNYVEDIKAQLPQISQENVIAEPEKKDTALAMLTGALFAMSKDPDAIVMNGASDHVIGDEAEFTRVMEAAVQIASSGKYLVAVGITPTRPDTAFGYIKSGEHLQNTSSGLPLFKVDSFTEKPNETTARAFLSTGRYFWNANMYVWSATALQQAFEAFMPDLYKLTEKLPTLANGDFQQELVKIYAESSAISIDYAISEKANNLVLIPGDFGWNDVGDWKVVYDLGKKDHQGNVVVGDGETDNTIALNSHGNLIHGNGRLIGLIGLNDMIIVDTDEILLIAPKARSQDVKKMVERLKEEGKKKFL